MTYSVNCMLIVSAVSSLLKIKMENSRKKQTVVSKEVSSGSASDPFVILGTGSSVENYNMSHNWLTTEQRFAARILILTVWYMIM